MTVNIDIKAGHTQTFCSAPVLKAEVQSMGGTPL